MPKNDVTGVTSTNQAPWEIIWKMKVQNPVRAKATKEPLLIREWNADEFHRRVLQLESTGYIARRDTYRVVAEINPETGEIIHLHTIEMVVDSNEGGEP